MHEIRIVSPRIHNLGDFAHCLPVVSGLSKHFEGNIVFIICERLKRFKGIKELLMAQGIFKEVHFIDDYIQQNGPIQSGILIDDTGSDGGYGNRPIAVHKTFNFVKSNYVIHFECDDDFELKIDDMVVEDVRDKIIIGDRWSPKDAPDVDTRRYSNLIENAEIIPKESAFYLDYTKDIMYNLNIIKHNTKPFVTTFTGIGILADLMKKETYVLWDEDMRTWQGLPVEHDFDLHYYKDRNAKLMYVRDFK